MAKNLHPKIQERKQSALPISFSFVNESGELVTRATKEKSLLKDRIVSGYGVIWASVNDWQERFVKGCFARSIADHGPSSNANFKIKFRNQHGKAVSLFAELSEDEVGLYFKSAPLDKIQDADDLLVQLESGTINNFSIGFKHIWDKVEWDDENDCLVILEARLYEISAVTIPSDINTFMIRSSSGEHSEPEYLEDDTEDIISDLPKSKQLEVRKLITPS